MAVYYDPPISGVKLCRQRKPVFQISMEERCRGSPAVFVSFLTAGALLEALT